MNSQMTLLIGGNYMEEKLPKSLSDVLDKINKTYGKGSIMSLGDQEPISKNLLSSGSLLIDTTTKDLIN